MEITPPSHQFRLGFDVTAREVEPGISMYKLFMGDHAGSCLNLNYCPGRSDIDGVEGNSLERSHMTVIPLAVYVHIPWCVRKCPYCDFNSHQASGEVPEQRYVDALLRDLALQAPVLAGRQVDSIFFGGGTPSLFAPSAIERIVNGISSMLMC